MLKDLSPKYFRSRQVDSINHHTTLQAPTTADRTTPAAISPLPLWVEPPPPPRDWDSKYHNKHPLSLRLHLLGILQQQQENQLVTQSIKHPLIHSDK